MMPSFPEIKLLPIECPLIPMTRRLEGCWRGARKAPQMQWTPDAPWPVRYSLEPREPFTVGAPNIFDVHWCAFLDGFLKSSKSSVKHLPQPCCFGRKRSCKKVQNDVQKTMTTFKQRPLKLIPPQKAPPCCFSPLCSPGVACSTRTPRPGTKAPRLMESRTIHWTLSDTNRVTQNHCDLTMIYRWQREILDNRRFEREHPWKSSMVDLPLQGSIVRGICLGGQSSAIKMGCHQQESVLLERNPEKSMVCLYGYHTIGDLSRISNVSYRP